MKRILSLVLLFTLLQHAQSQEKAALPSWAFGNFIRPATINPIVSPDSTTFFFDPLKKTNVYWESNDTFNPASTIYKGKIVVLYRAEDKSGVGIGFRTSRLGYAESTDGLTFKRKKQPVFYPAEDNQKEMEWPGGCEDPRIAVTEDGTYVMFYTQWNRKNARLGVATSKNLMDWKKHGPIFKQAYQGKYADMWSKSAAILTAIKDGKQVIAKINGKYFMYWGEAGVCAATSEDLINWSPVEDEQQKLKVLFTPRAGYFDSELTECGPPAVLTDKGIVLLYNGKNKEGTLGDTAYASGAYCGGQALFDAKDPLKFIVRLDKPFFYPTEPFEKSGQYKAGTVFMEGLTFFRGKWYMYYGCADSRTAVAVFDPTH